MRADPFTDVLGARRGESVAGTLAAFDPDPASVREARRLSSLARGGELEAPVAALCAHGRALSESIPPLLAGLLEAVLAITVARAHEHYRSLGREFLDQAGIRGPLADQLILAPTGTLHCWPDGPRIAGSPHGKTVCGLSVGANWQRVPRGSWREQSYRNCRRCGLGSADRAESFDYPLWRQTIATYDVFDMENFTAAVSDAARPELAKLMRALPAPRAVQYHAPARVAFQRTLVEHAARYAESAGRTPAVIARILGPLAEPLMMELRTSRPHELLDNGSASGRWHDGSRRSPARDAFTTLYADQWRRLTLEAPDTQRVRESQRQDLARALARVLRERAGKRRH